MIGTLADLASMPGMPSEPTLRKLIEADPDFEGIIKRAAGKGDAYEIDLALAARYVVALDEKKREAEQARLDEIAQLGFDLGLANAGAAPGLTIADRKALLEEEVIAVKLARMRGELVPKGSVEAALGQVLVWHQQQASSFSARLAKRADLARALQIEIDSMMAADLAEFARRLRKLAEIEAGEDGDIVGASSAAMEDSAV